MMGTFRSAATWIVGAAGAAVTLMASVSFKDAASNFSSWMPQWVLDALPALTSPQADLYLKGVGLTLAGLAILWLVVRPKKRVASSLAATATPLSTTASTEREATIRRAHLRVKVAGTFNLTDSHNVSSVTDEGTGRITVTFVAPFDGDYGVIPIAGNTDRYKVVAQSPSSISLVFPDGDPARMDFRFEANNALVTVDMSAKVAAIDEALSIFGHEGKWQAASKVLRETRAVWEEQAKAGNRDEYLANLRKAATAVRAVLAEAENLSKRYAIYDDISQIVKAAVAGVDLYPLSEMIDNYKRLEPNASANTLYLFKHYADAARPPINKMDELRTETEKALIAFRRALSA